MTWFDDFGNIVPEGTGVWFTPDIKGKKAQESKFYLGDGVYVALLETGQILLTTENGIEVTNRVYLEYREFKKLSGIVDRWAIRT